MSFKMQRPKELKDWQSSVPVETIERAKKVLKGEQHNFSSTANYIGVGATDKDISPYLESACHASMSNVFASCRDVLATENGRFRRYKSVNYNLSVEQARPFLKWFLYESPYGFVILNRDDFEYCEQYGFVIAGDAPTTLVQCACIISRHFYEATTCAFIEFNKLVNRGIDGFIAYQICFNSNISVSLLHQELATLKFYSGPSHRVSTAVSPEQMLNYYKGDIQNPLGKTYKVAPTIYGSTNLFLARNIKDSYDTAWNLPKFRKHNKPFHNFLLEKEEKLDKSAVYRPPNPFATKVKGLDEFAFTCEQAVTDVADYCQQYITEHLENV